jgi:hypothetical protein
MINLLTLSNSKKSFEKNIYSIFLDFDVFYLIQFVLPKPFKEWRF